MSIDQEKMIVEALPSLYPLKDYEEDAIHAVIDALPPAQPEPLQPWEVLAAQAVLSQPAEPKRETSKELDKSIEEAKLRRIKPPTANTPEGSGILKMVSLDNVKRYADKCIDWGWTLQDFRKNTDEWDEDTVDITETEGPMTAKEYLSRYRDAVRESREIELKITQLRLRYGAPSAINYSDMPKSHNSEHDLSDYMEKLEELNAILLGKYERCLGIMVDIEMRLDRMDAGPNTQIEREVLRHRYTDITDQGRLASWDSVSVVVGYSRRQVERFHGSALQHFPTD